MATLHEEQRQEQLARADEGLGQRLRGGNLKGLNFEKSRKKAVKKPEFGFWQLMSPGKVTDKSGREVKLSFAQKFKAGMQLADWWGKRISDWLKPKPKPVLEYKDYRLDPLPSPKDPQADGSDEDPDGAPNSSAKEGEDEMSFVAPSGEEKAGPDGIASTPHADDDQDAELGERKVDEGDAVTPPAAPSANDEAEPDDASSAVNEDGDRKPGLEEHKAGESGDVAPPVVSGAESEAEPDGVVSAPEPDDGRKAVVDGGADASIQGGEPVSEPVAEDSSEVARPDGAASSSKSVFEGLEGRSLPGPGEGGAAAQRGIERARQRLAAARAESEQGPVEPRTRKKDDDLSL